MHSEVEKLLTQSMPGLHALCDRFGVRRLRLFGSALTSDWDPSRSDLDFAAEFGPPPKGVDLFAQFFVFQHELRNLLGRSIDLVEVSAIRKPNLLLEIDTRGVELYAA